MSGIPINYMGDETILTNPLYLKYSTKTIGQSASDLAALKAHLKEVTGNMDNLKLIAYLSTILRAIELTA